MKTLFWTIAVIAAFGVGYYVLKRNSKSTIDKIRNAKNDLIQVSSEECETLKMEDVVAYFKSKNLVKDRHIPFVARAKRFKEYMANANILPDDYDIVLGVYDETSDSLTSLKIVKTKKWATDFAAALGTDELVVLN